MRGLPSRDWRTGAANYGAVQQTSVTWKDRVRFVIKFLCDGLRRAFRVVSKWWKAAWAWAMARPTRARRITAGSMLLFGTFVVVFASLTALYKWLVAEDPCLVMERERIQVLEEGETDGVFTELPKIVHWEIPNGDEIPAGTELTEWNQEFRRLFPEPEYRHEIWGESRIRELVRSKYPWFLNELEKTDSSTSVSCTRFFILQEHGGLFANLDYQAAKNFWDLLPKNRPAILESPYKYREEYQGILISSPAAHPFWNVTVDLVRSKLEQGSAGGWFGGGRISCNGILNDAVKRAKRTDLGDRAVYDLLCEVFNRVPVGEYNKYLPFYSRWWRSILSMTFLVKPCGDIQNSKCVMGYYHDSALKALTGAS